jgi:DNA topoisomerase 2-associated protein PAT1
MSFFGFDTTLPRDRGHQQAAAGFAAPHDAFADLSGPEASENVYVLPKAAPC